MPIVEIKKSARAVNDQVESFITQNGKYIEVGSLEDARKIAQDWSRDEAPVRIQKSAPQESDDVDAYLISDPDRSIDTPIDVEDGKHTFHVSGNQYGALGETLIASNYGLGQGIQYIIRSIAGIDNWEQYRIEHKQNPELLRKKILHWSMAS